LDLLGPRFDRHFHAVAETVRAAHESWNRRDSPAVIRNAAEGLVYTDHSRSVTLNTRDKFREWTEAWAQGFSDARITNPEYIDAGDIVIAQFIVVCALRDQNRSR
jgi:hypothetical protein